MAELAAAPLLRPDQADEKYAEAVQTAVEKCAEDTKDQTCYICMDGATAEEGLVRMCACRGASGFAHVSCLARQAEVAVKRRRRHGGPGFGRWRTCGLCEQDYYGAVRCALGWACWKTYLGLPEQSLRRRDAMTQLGNGLYSGMHYEDATSVYEADLAMRRRLGRSENSILVVQGNLAGAYKALRRFKDALRMSRDVYSGYVRLHGEEDRDTCQVASNYAYDLLRLQRFEEAKSLLRKVVPVARRFLGDSNDVTLQLQWIYARALYRDTDATLDHLREAMTTLEETIRTVRRVLGEAHPLTTRVAISLRNSQAALRAREDAKRFFDAKAEAAAIKKRQRRETIERERSRRRTG